MSNDEPPSRGFSAWLDTLKNLFNREPQNREDLLDTLQFARDQALIDTDAQSMIEGVLAVSDLRVRDIMIPRAEMAVIGRDDTLEQVLPVVIESAHSRFPVIGEDRAEVVGIMLAKDLLQYCGENAKKFNLPSLPIFSGLPEKEHKEFPLVLISSKSRFYLHSSYRWLKPLREKRKHPTAQIHPETAEKLGIKDGDAVNVRHELGAALGGHRLDEAKDRLLAWPFIPRGKRVGLCSVFCQDAHLGFREFSRNRPASNSGRRTALSGCRAGRA